MDNDDEGYSYAGMILGRWEKIGILRESVRTKQISSQADTELLNQYIAALTSMWEELYPAVQGRTDLKDVKTDFDDFEKYYHDPQLLSPKVEADKSNAKDIYKLDMCLRRVLDKLKLTPFPANTR